MPLVPDAAATVIALVLLHASVRDLRTATIKDWHWIAVAVPAFAVAFYAGHLSAAISASAWFGVVGGLLVLLRRWGLGDGLMLAAIGAAVYPAPFIFLYAFFLMGMAYLMVWRFFLGNKARIMPVFFLAFVVTYVGLTSSPF